jgi:hypothetical protein
MSQTVVDRRPIIVRLSFSDHFGGVAAVLAVTLTHNPDEPALLSELGGILGQMGVGKIVKAGQLFETVLAAKFVEPGYAALAIAN